MVQIITPTRLLPGGLQFLNSSQAIKGYREAEDLKIAQHGDQRSQQDQEYEQWQRDREKKLDQVDAETVNGMPSGEIGAEEDAPSPWESSSPRHVRGWDEQPSSAPAPTPDVSGGRLSSISSTPTAAEAAPPIPQMQDTSGIHLEPTKSGSWAQSGTRPSKLSALNLMPGFDGTGTDANGTPTAPPPGAAPAPMPTIPVATRPEPQMAQDPVAQPASVAPPQAGPAPITGGKLASVRSGMTAPGLDRKLAQGYAKAGLGSAAVGALHKSIAGEKQDYDTESKRALEILDMAEKGDIDGAMLMGQRYNYNIDPQVLSNGKARRIMRTTVEMAKAANASHDQAWQQKFAESYGTSGDIQTAMQAAGKPTAPPQKVGTYKPITVNKGGKDVVGTYNTTSGATGPELGNAPIKNPNQRQTNEQINFSWMTRPVSEGGRGMTPQQADKIINEVKNNPGAKVNAVAALMRSYIAADMDPAKARAQAMSDYNFIERQVKGGGAAQPAPGGGGGKPPPSIAAPGTQQVPQAAPRGAGAPASQNFVGPNGEALVPDEEGKIHLKNDQGDEIYSLDGDTWYNSDDDTRYDEGG